MNYLIVLLLPIIFVSCAGRSTSEKDSTLTNTAATSIRTSDKESALSATTSGVASSTMQASNELSDQIPAGYRLFFSTTGDLNSDGIPDEALIIKGTSADEWKENTFGEIVDRNRRGIMIFLSNNDYLELKMMNQACFSSENEEGGAYYAPELDLEIEDQKLSIIYRHGRYGYWWHTFRYQDGTFARIGYDRHEHRGPVMERIISANFLTGRIKTLTNINELAESEEDEELSEEWTRINQSPVPLGIITDFDELGLEPYVD